MTLMLAVGMLIVWGGYSLSLWGWCLLQGYDVTLGQLMSPTHPYAGRWPPPPVGDDVIFPGGRTGSSSGTAASPAGTASSGPKPGSQPGVYIRSGTGGSIIK